MDVESSPIAELSADPANARTHGERNIDAIKASLRRFGQQKPIVVDSSGVVRAGNGTLEAAQALGWDAVDIVRTPLQGSEATAYAIADNRSSELAEWDDPTLAATLEGLQFDDPELLTAAGFEQSDLDALLEEVNPAEIEEDEAPEPPEDPITQPGDLWILGEHRVLCGDCRSDVVVAILMDVQEINLAITSPPYASQRTYDEETEFKPIQPSSYVEWFAPVQANIASHLSSDGSWMLNIKENCEDGERLLFVKDLTLAHVRLWGWNFVDEFCWERVSLPGAYPNRFKNGWEPIFHFTRNANIKFRPDAVAHASQANEAKTCDEVIAAGKQSGYTKHGSGGGPGSVRSKNRSGALPPNVLHVSGVERNVFHPAMFPVGVPAFFIKAYTDESDVVYDPFLGSGTTLIAAEQLGRKCYGMEISPAYCDVIVQRWENLTNKKAELDGS